MKLNSYNIFGIPVQNFTLGTASEKILSLFYAHEKGTPPYYVSTLNTDYIANVYGWGLIEPADPELLQILRQSRFTTADGFPLVLLSRLLGNPLNGRVTGADLVPDLLELMHAKNLSVYILGGEEAMTRQAAENLQQKYKGLKICGMDCSMVHVKGARLIESSERDSLILEQINKAQPDLLLICLGNPKQEVWFSRVRDRLQVSVAIGVGGTLNFISGNIKRAPLWFQEWGLEWVWRIGQEPRRLLRRYLHDGMKFLWLGVPLVIYHHLNHLLARFFTREIIENEQNLLFISSHDSIGVIRCPRFLGKETLGVLDGDLSDAAERDAIILDMRQTAHMDLLGIAFLIETWMWAKEKNKKVFLLGLRRHVKLLLMLHKTWDLFRDGSFHSPRDIVNQFKTGEVYEAISQTDDAIKISFFGLLDQRVNFDEYLYRLAPMIQLKNCILDFNFCTFIDNKGISFLLELRQIVHSHKKQLRLTGMNKTIKNQLKAAKVVGLFDS